MSDPDSPSRFKAFKSKLGIGRSKTPPSETQDTVSSNVEGATVSNTSNIEAPSPWPAEWESYFTPPPPLTSDSQSKTSQQEQGQYPDARSQLRAYIRLTYQSDSFPTMEAITSAVNLGAEREIFHRISDCATQILKAAHVCDEDDDRDEKDKELVHTLLKKWQKCRGALSDENVKFVGSVPREELIQMLRDAMADCAAALVREKGVFTLRRDWS